MSDSQEKVNVTQEAQAQEACDKVHNEPLCACGRKPKKAKRNLSDETRARLSEKAKTNDWAKHVAEFRKANPDIKGRDVMSKAKETYKRPEKKE